jgi:DNA helicase II / ATP-dependent DNA helicase PcrA
VGSTPFQLMPDQQTIQDQYHGGKAAVLATPGAGKTTLISRLIAHWIKEKGVAGRSVVVLTFTENAARTFEMRTRPLLAERGPGQSLPTFSTIHGFCNRLLRQLDPNYTERQVASDERRYAVLDGLLQAENLWSSDLDYTRLVADSLIPSYRQQPYLHAPETPEALSLWSGIDSEHGPLLMKLPALVKAYDQALAEAALIDYDLMILATYTLLQNNNDLLQRLRQRYHYLLEDEAQDSNTVQSALLALICGPEGNWLRVGDPNQSIYGFGGADFRQLQHFADSERAFPMAQSNRSSEDIMRFANDYQRRFAESFPSSVQLEAGFKNPEAGWIWVKTYAHLQDELEANLQAARRLLSENQSVGVLCRTNINGQWMHEQFQKAGIPSVLHHDRADHFFQTDIVKTVAQVFDFLMQPHQFYCYQQVLLMLGIERHTLKLLLNPETPVATQMQNLAEGMSYHPAAADSDYQRLLQLNRQLLFLVEHAHYPLNDLLAWIAEKLVNNSEDRMLLRILEGMWYQTQSLANAPQVTPSLETFRQWIEQAGSRKIRQALIPESAKTDLTAKGTLHILTVHKAKGLEWDGVLMPLFHFGKPFDFPDTEVRILQKCLQTGSPYPTLLDEIKTQEEAESIRLVYVGITRARRFLSLTRSLEKSRSAGVYQSGEDALFTPLHQIYKTQKTEV